MNTRLTVGLIVAFVILMATPTTEAQVSGVAASNFGQKEPLPEFGTIHMTPDGSIVRVNGLLQGGGAPDVGEYVDLFQIRAIPNPVSKPAIRMAVGRVERIYSRQNEKIDFSLLMTNAAARSVAKLRSEAVHVKLASPFQAELLLINSDWSAVEDAKQVESDMRKALKNASVPKGLLDKLPGSGPEILFSPESITHYSVPHYIQLLAWLKSKQLIKSVDAFPAPTNTGQAIAPSGFPGARGNPRGARGGFARQYDTMLSQPYEWLRETNGVAQLDGVSEDVPRPFVTRKTMYNWSIGEVQKVSDRGLKFQRTTGIMEMARGQPTKLHQEVDKTYFECTIPRDYVAIMHAFPHRFEAHLRAAASQRGFIPLIVSIPTALVEDTAEDGGKLHPPDMIQTLTQNGDILNTTVTPPPSRVPMLGDIGLLGVSDFPADAPGFGPISAGRDDGQPPPVVQQETRIFRLKTTQAKSIESLVEQLFRDDLKIVADESKNSLLVRGTKRQLAELEKLMEMVEGNPEPPEDAATDTENTVGKSNPSYRYYYYTGKPKYASDATPTESPDELRQMYAAAEQKAQQTAARLRDLKPETGDSNTTAALAESLKEQLRREVAEAFAARQKLQQAELTQIRERTKELEQTIEVRERIKDEIIERRTQDLLNPNLQWETTSPGDRSASTSTTNPTDEAKDVGATEPLDVQVDLTKKNTIELQGRWRINMMKQGRDDFILDGKLAEDFDDDDGGDWFIEVNDSTFAIRHGRKNAVWLMASMTSVPGYSDAFELDDPNDPKPEHILGRFAVQGESLRLCFKPDSVDGKPPALMAGEKIAYLECTRAPDRVTVGAIAN